MKTTHFSFAFFLAGVALRVFADEPTLNFYFSGSAVGAIKETVARFNEEKRGFVLW